MANSNLLTYEAAKQALRGEDTAREAAFDILRTIASLTNQAQPGPSHGRELLIRALEYRESFENYADMLGALLRREGLFPYLANPEKLPIQDLLAYEAHRPIDYDESIVFHRIQADVYRSLLSGRSVILSAPTSFGKSMVLDALAATGRFNNIVVVVPTLALIDEVRRKLARYSDVYKIVTHTTQSLGTKNIIVMTQERLLDLEVLPDVDLYMIDEFYKLDIPDADGGRAALLNQALYRLRKTGAPFYLTGPNVEQLVDGLPPDFQASFIATDFGTVAVDLTVLPKPERGTELQALADLCATLSGPTLIYCSSPGKARDAARALISSNIAVASPATQPASRWVAQNYHPGWLVGQALAQGVGIHHGQVPRALAQYQVRAFNDGLLPFLICTSTLIEGVNTAAKNVVIFNHQINRRNLDFFTYANIRGRSGRMWRHFVGNVFTFWKPPQEELPSVDIPVYTQGDTAPESLLIQLNREELKDSAWDRVSEYYSQTLVPLDTLRSNSGIDPKGQISLVEEVRASISSAGPALSWTGYPKYDQLEFALGLIERHIRPIRTRDHGVSSARQLTFKVMLASSSNGDITKIIENELNNGLPEVRDDADAAVESALGFMRQWPGYEVPRLLHALQLLVAPELERNGFTCDYSVFAAAALNLFLPPHVATLEEYGLPYQVAVKVIRRAPGYDSLDELLELVRDGSSTARLDAFETDLLQYAREGL